VSYRNGNLKRNKRWHVSQPDTQSRRADHGRVPHRRLSHLSRWHLVALLRGKATEHNSATDATTCIAAANVEIGPARG